MKKTLIVHNTPKVEVMPDCLSKQLIWQGVLQIMLLKINQNLFQVSDRILL